MLPHGYIARCCHKIKPLFEKFLDLLSTQTFFISLMIKLIINTHIIYFSIFKLMLWGIAYCITSLLLMFMYKSRKQFRSFFQHRTTTHWFCIIVVITAATLLSLCEKSSSGSRQLLAGGMYSSSPESETLSSETSPGGGMTEEIYFLLKNIFVVVAFFLKGNEIMLTNISEHSGILRKYFGEV